MDQFRIHIGNVDFIEHNESKSTYGVLRGLHFQKPPFAQSKLVRVIEGRVLDIAVDIRVGSPFYGEYVSVILDSDIKSQLWVPKGFARGFLVLSNVAVVNCLVDNYYAHQSDAGIIWNDKFLNIDWKAPIDDVILSDKDMVHKEVKQDNSFNYNNFTKEVLYGNSTLNK
jgi:dTDP-4-dehydrorhamnose 3,5-epimerase